MDRIFWRKSKPALFKYTFWGIFISLFITLNISFYHFINISFQIFNILYVCLLELAAFGFSYEITQLIFILILKEVRLPFLEKLKNYPPVALLCTTCDNVSVEILRNLNRQTYPNLNIFILDDSKNNKSQSDVDSLGFHVIRRTKHIGYKAGNLNNWLRQYGDNFPYFIVADADSLLPNTFVEQMICYAEHPDNDNVAIFETLVNAWNHKNLFSRLIGTMSPIIHRFKLCLDNRFYSTLSVGHNNLYRTSVIKEIGGFTENYLAEDYATSIEVLRKNYLCMTVPIITYERLPENFQEFVGRQSRWTIQTFQLMNLKVSNLCWYILLYILMTLHYYLMPIVAFLGMSLLAFSNMKYLIFLKSTSPLEISSMELLFRNNTLLFWMSYLLFPIFLRGVIALRVGISVNQYLLSSIFQTSLFFGSLWPVIRRLISFWDSKRFHFNVTACVPCPSLQQIILINVPCLILIWITSLLVVLTPIWNSLNLFWAIPASISPFLINYIQRKDLYGD